MRRPPDPPISARLDGLLSSARADVATPAQMQRMAARLSVATAVSAMGAAKAAAAPLRWSLMSKVGVVGVAVVGLATVGVTLRPRPAPPAHVLPHAERMMVPPPAPTVAPELEPEPDVRPIAVPAEAAPAEATRAVAVPRASAPRASAPRPVPHARPPRPAPVLRRTAIARSAPVVELPASVPPVVAAPEPPVAPPPPAAPAPSSEARRLLEARALIGHDPASALELLALHEEQFPISRLAQERELLAVDALIRLGRHAEARGRVEAFRQRYPGSAHQKRLDALEAAARP